MEAKEYEGRTVEYCSGRLVSSADRGIFYGTLVLILIPALAWFGFVCPWYVRLALVDGLMYALLVPTFSLFLAAHTLVALFLCAFTDPGILPRGMAAFGTTCHTENCSLIHKGQIRKVQKKRNSETILHSNSRVLH
jgi:hypothetical protein